MAQKIHGIDVFWVWPSQDANGKWKFIEIPYYTCNNPGLPLLLAGGHTQGIFACILPQNQATCSPIDPLVMAQFNLFLS